MKKILIANNHDSFVFNLVELLRRIDECVFDIRFTEDISLASVHSYDGILLSPGPGLPCEQNNLMSLIDYCHTTHSILGVCLGHQAIAEYFGGKIFRQKTPLHGHVDRLERIEGNDLLLKDIPPGSVVGRYHSWAVDPISLPNDLEVTSYAESDGAIMSLSHTRLSVHGVQFHPESYITQRGETYIRNWIVSI